MKSLPLVVSMLVTAFPSHAAQPASEGFKKLGAAQIRAAFAGKTFSDDIHFRNLYKVDGSIEGMSMGRKIANKWKIENDTLCIKDRFDELCYVVWKKGNDIQLIYENTDVIISGSVK